MLSSRKLLLDKVDISLLLKCYHKKLIFSINSLVYRYTCTRNIKEQTMNSKEQTFFDTAKLDLTQKNV